MIVMKKGFILINTLLVFSLFSMIIILIFDVNTNVLNKVQRSNDLEYELYVCRSIIEFFKAENRTMDNIEVEIDFDDFSEVKQEILKRGFYEYIILMDKKVEHKKYKVIMKFYIKNEFNIIKVRCMNQKGGIELIFAKPYEI
ncbi:hypothetical protein SAMN05660865_01088 [Caloramator fervidus]|uniref:Competence protein ComGF n=2 Tax=Caloramator fervidus TaxID=29344 RepID=A0A1H5V389_9CLOT|nr:hypothetical protein SAMN05660865_01088 [Caloramator fervidus]